MKRLLRLSLVVAGVWMALTACNKEKVQTADSLSVVSSFWAEDGNRPAYEELMRGYEETHGVKVEDVSEESNNEWKNKVVKSFEDGNEPDVLFFYSGGASDSIVEGKKVVSIGDIRKVYPDYASNINASVINGMKAKDGEAYAIPVTGYWESLFVNRDLFEKYAVEVPVDWEDFLDAVRKFKENGVVPVAVSLSEIPHYLFEYFIYNQTGPINHLQSVPADADNLPEAWIKGLGRFKELYDLGAFPEDMEGTGGDEAVRMFQDKEAAMMLDGSWMVGRIRDTQNVAVIPFPYMEGGPRKGTDTIAGFSMGFYITKKAWDDPLKQKAAVDYISYMTSNDAIETFNVGVVTPSITTRKEKEAKNPLLASVLELNGNSTAYVGAVQDTFKQEAQTDLFEKLPLIAKGSVTPEEALKEFVENNR